MNKKKRLRILTFLISLSSLFILSCGNPLILQLLDPKTVSFETNGGSSVDSQTVFRDHPVKRPPDPSKDGYTFDAWYIHNDNFDEQWDFNDIPTASFTLYANWYPEGPGTAFITSVAIIVTGPATGETPDPEASGAENFNISPVTWEPNHDLFLIYVAYTATVTLTAHPGYTFAESIAATINGEPANPVENTGDKVTLSRPFAQTGKAVTAITVKVQPEKRVYTHGDTLNLSRLAVTLTHDDDTTEDVELVDFVLKNISANPAHGAVLSRSTHNGQPVIVSIGSHSADTSTLIVNKAAGAEVSAPTAAETKVDSITLAPVTTPTDTGQGIEYAISNNESAPTSDNDWQTSRTFNDLTSGVTYYFFARSAANENYDAGTPSAGTPIATHVHEWSEWVVITPATETTDGEEAIMCTTCGEVKDTHTLYATGTSGLDFAQIEGSNPAAYRVSRGSVEGNIVIPAYHRPEANSPYLPVTTISNGFDVWNNGAFSGAESAPNTTVTSITFAAGSRLTTIAAYAFLYCTGLASIEIPASVTSIGMCAFQNCESLTSIDIPEGVTSLNDTFYQCYALETVNFAPDSKLTTIGNNAFYNCTGLASITIPANVESIQITAFSNCTYLKIITIDTDKVTQVNGNQFAHNNNWGTIFPADGLSVTFNKDVGANAFYSTSNNKLTRVTIGAGVRTIGNSAFRVCIGLISITIHEGVTSIVENAFEGCTSLESITIPASVTTIGGSAFKDCTGLTSVTIPNSVTAIGQSAFQDCTNLGSITIPASVTSIGGSAFQECTGLTTVVISNGARVIGNNMFLGCTSLASIIIPNSVTSIGSGAFQECTGLTNVTIPASVTDIGAWAFAYCIGLTSVTISNGARTIGANMFYGCTSLASIIIPNSVTTIGAQAFNNCASLTSVTFNGTISGSFATDAFSGDLYDKHLAGGMGTYTRPSGTSTTWAKE